MEYKDFSSLINSGAFNEKGGLHKSSIIEKSLVDHFVPFLPMERDHVRSCILEAAAGITLTKTEIDTVLSHLSFWPKQSALYSATGCKRVSHLVDLVIESKYDEL